MKIIFSPQCLEYEYPGHPESPQRVRSAYEYLQEKGYEFSRPKQASQEDILLVHSKALLERVKNSNFFDPDTPNLKNIFYYAALSAGAAIMAMELCLEGCPAFSLILAIYLPSPTYKISS